MESPASALTRGLENTKSETQELWTPNTTPSNSVEAMEATEYSTKIPIANAAKEMLARSSTKGSLISKSYSLLNVNSFDERVTDFDFSQFEEFDRMDAEMEKNMLAGGKEIVNILEDGNCLFRSVAQAIYSDQERHMDVRSACMDYIQDHKEDFELFLCEEFDSYVARKRREREYGSEIELMAISCQLQRPIHVYRYSDVPTTQYEPVLTGSPIPISLSYHRNVHYNLLQNKPKEESRPGSDIFEMNE
jgi:hypothetical protein